MIIVFTSNENGGLIQMAIKVTEELYKLGTEVQCFIPTVAKCSIPKEIHTFIVRYKKTKSPFPYNNQFSFCLFQVQIQISFLYYLQELYFLILSY